MQWPNLGPSHLARTSSVSVPWLQSGVSKAAAGSAMSNRPRGAAYCRAKLYLLINPVLIGPVILEKARE